MLNRLREWMDNSINSRLVTSCILTCSLLITNTALAEYKPPANQKPPSSRTTSTVARGGCEGSGGTSLTALAPYSHIGQTVSTHPTFAWYVPDAQSYPLELRLYQYDISGDTKIQTIKLQSYPGVMTWSIPEEQPGLLVGQRYRWQVVILCNPNRPSNALVTEADIEVVAMPSALANALSTTGDRLIRANLYAELGLWYDALGEALGTTEAPTQLKHMLLEDLARLEEQLASNSEQSFRLRQIIERLPRSSASQNSRLTPTVDYSQLPISI